jgi:DNA-binding response OmpR family regulator
MKVLIVEDEVTVARFVKQACEEAGYSTTCATDGLEALQLAKSLPFDLILLDVMLPGLNGFEVCHRLRQNGIKARVLMLTSRDSTEDKVEGLDAGADDYIVKPFKMAELLARMRALRRRGGSLETLQVADLILDPTNRSAQRGGKAIPLSVTEYALLEMLMRHANSVLSRSEILDHVWSYDFGGADNILDVYIMYLRNKIDKGHSRRLIQTIRGVGFCLGCDS